MMTVLYQKRLTTDLDISNNDTHSNIEYGLFKEMIELCLNYEMDCTSTPEY